MNENDDDCPRCYGTGIQYVPIGDGANLEERDCPRCKGTGNRSGTKVARTSGQ